MVITEHDGEGVGFRTAGNDDGSTTRAEVAELLWGRAVGDLAANEPLEVPHRHGGCAVVIGGNAEKVGFARARVT